MGAPLVIDNRRARWLLLEALGLSPTPTGPLDLLGQITDLGFVQLDTIQYLARAHHHILWSRNQNYREPMLNPLMQRDRAVFEHFTHDASVLPMSVLPYWQRQFRRMRDKLARSNWYGGMPDAAGLQALKDRIRAEGPLSTHAFDSGPRKKAVWSRPAHKQGLDYLWHVGELATCHRDGFTKVYDLAERVFPPVPEVADAAQLDWLCRAALERLVFAAPGDVQRFWDAADNKEVRDWCAASDLVPVQVMGADGAGLSRLALPGIEARLEAVRAPTSRLRILNPFDPLIRDRARLSAVFGFDYRIEIFVPAAKRKWGYYVCPLLEGDRFVGRIEVKANRAKARLEVLSLWPEPGVKWTAARQHKLEAELDRMARFLGCPEVCWL